MTNGDRIALSGYMEMLDDTVDLDIDGMLGGEPVRILLADYDRLTAELQAVRAELARVRRNHLRRMEGYLQRILWNCAMHPINRRNMGGWQRGHKLYNAIRAALANNAKDET